MNNNNITKISIFFLIQYIAQQVYYSYFEFNIMLLVVYDLFDGNTQTFIYINLFINLFIY
jgi:hypothetical protein